MPIATRRPAARSTRTRRAPRDATIPRTDRTRMDAAAIVTTTIVSTTRSMTIVPRIIDRLRPVRGPEVVAPHHLAEPRRQHVVREVPHEQRRERREVRHPRRPGRAAPPPHGPRSRTSMHDERDQRGDPARVGGPQRLQRRRDVDGAEDEGEGDHRDGDPEGRPAQAATEAHRQAARGSFEDWRGPEPRRAADPDRWSRYRPTTRSVERPYTTLRLKPTELASSK